MARGAPSFAKPAPFFHLYAVCKLLMQATVSEMRAYKKVYRQTKKAEREAAAVPPNRSDRWQAIFLFKKIEQSDCDYGQPL